MRAANPTSRDLRRINRRTILETIYQVGSISRQELGQLSRLSLGTVTNVVTELLAEEILLEAGFEATEGGRPRSILQLNREYGYFFGVEIGETDVTIQCFDLTLHTLKRMKYLLSSEESNPEHMVQCVIDGALTTLSALQIPATKILGMGLGIPGIIAHADDSAVLAPAWNWERVPLKSMINAHLQFPLFLDNGSKTMALAEMQASSSASRKDTMIVANIGTGVGAGIIYEGKLYHGTTNSAGEWGHTIMALNGELCRCGHRGCLEAYVGAPGIIRHLRQLAPDSPLLQDNDEIRTITLLKQQAIEGNPVAKEVLSNTAHYLGAGLANLINLFNPQSIILGGWLGILLGTFLLPEVRCSIEQYALQQPLKATEIVVSTLGKDAGCKGAAMLALEGFFTSVLQHPQSGSKKAVLS